MVGGPPVSTMSKGSNRRYELVTYEAPTPNALGLSSEGQPPPIGKAQPQFAFGGTNGLPPMTFSTRQGPSLSRRLAMYEKDDPTYYRIALFAGFLFPPIWWVAAICATRISDVKTNTKKMGRYNMYLSVVSLVIVCIVWWVNSGSLRREAEEQMESIADVGRP